MPACPILLVQLQIGHNGKILKSKSTKFSPCRGILHCRFSARKPFVKLACLPESATKAVSHAAAAAVDRRLLLLVGDDVLLGTAEIRGETSSNFGASLLPGAYLFPMFALHFIGALLVVRNSVLMRGH